MQKRDGFQTFGFKLGRHHLVVANPNIFVLRICFACLASLPLGVFALNSGCMVPAQNSIARNGRGCGLKLCAVAGRSGDPAFARATMNEPFISSSARERRVPNILGERCGWRCPMACCAASNKSDKKYLRLLSKCSNIFACRSNCSLTLADHEAQVGGSGPAGLDDQIAVSAAPI